MHRATVCLSATKHGRSMMRQARTCMPLASTHARTMYRNCHPHGCQARRTRPDVCLQLAHLGLKSPARGSKQLTKATGQSWCMASSTLWAAGYALTSNLFSSCTIHSVLYIAYNSYLELQVNSHLFCSPRACSIK